VIGASSTAGVVVDGDVDLDPIVDLELEPRSAILDEDSTAMTSGSTCKVEDGVDVERRRQGRRLGVKHEVDVDVSGMFPAFDRRIFSRAASRRR
jgi:hypothetical protein